MATSLKAYATCVTVLYLKFLVTTGIQAVKTFDAGARPPEDKDLALAQGRPPQTYGLLSDNDDETLRSAKLVELRWKRIVMNDLESIPLALIVFGTGVLTDANQIVLTTAMIVYTVLRCGHTYAYAKELQPHRAICWRGGVIATLVGAVSAVVGAYSK